MPGPAIRTGLDTAGGIIRSASGTKVFVEGRQIGVAGDPVDPHGSGSHAGAVMVGGSGKVFIQGIPALRGGIDSASCGHISSSSSKVIVGP
jgi:uncharacterized Zn-binding protein involved in type VI secretion